MTDRSDSTTDQGLTRRTVLRRGTAAAAGVVAVGAFATPVAAHACPRTPGYWKNHRWPGEGDDSVGLNNVNSHVPGVNFADEDEGRAFLKESKNSGDKGTIMAFHLIAFILNNQFACVADVNRAVTDVDGDSDPETILEIKGYAQEWLEESGWTMNGPALDSWIVPSATVSDGEVLKNLLDRYNNRTLFDGCSCVDEIDQENVTGGGRRRGR